MNCRLQLLPSNLLLSLIKYLHPNEIMCLYHLDLPKLKEIFSEKYDFLWELVCEKYIPFVQSRQDLIEDQNASWYEAFLELVKIYYNCQLCKCVIPLTINDLFPICHPCREKLNNSDRLCFFCSSRTITDMWRLFPICVQCWSRQGTLLEQIINYRKARLYQLMDLNQIEHQSFGRLQQISPWLRGIYNLPHMSPGFPITFEGFIQYLKYHPP